MDYEIALAFAAVVLVAGQLFIEYRSTNNAFEPAVVKQATKDIGRASWLP
jgi:hypothetical protein